MALQLVVKNAEVKLMQSISDMRAVAGGWQAIHFHLSKLLDVYKSEYQVKIALNLIHDLLKNSEGAIFLLIDSSIIVMCRGVDQGIIDKLVFQLRYLYMDDPLAYNDAGQENPAFCAIYDLRYHWQEFYDLCARNMAAYTRKQPLSVQPDHITAADHMEGPELRVPVIERQIRTVADHQLEEIVEEMGRESLSASKLVMIERDLRHADLSRVIRRQPVCAVLPDMKVRRVFDEFYIHIAHLRQTLYPEVDFLSDRWLFKYLTRALDRRMLEVVRSGSSHYLATPISLNLNVETLLSPEFAELDAILKPANKVSIVIEVPVVDVFADMTAFILARSEAQKLGYRICLDGLTTASFASISREKLGVDLLKVQWNADIQKDLTEQHNLALAEAVRSAGGNRVILCRCDNRSAVEYGHALGISLFQGRYIDNVLNPTAKVEN